MEVVVQNWKDCDFLLSDWGFRRSDELIEFFCVIPVTPSEYIQMCTVANPQAYSRRSVDICSSTAAI